jgi:hypothetical protein
MTAFGPKRILAISYYQGLGNPILIEIDSFRAASPATRQKRVPPFCPNWGTK